MDDVPVEQIRANFRRLASSCGEPEPTDLRYVFSTFQIADTAVYGGPTHTNSPDPDTPVVVVTGRGSFVPPKQPPGITPPTAQHLTGIWRHPDGEIAAYSISQRDPDLSGLGSVIKV